MKYLPFARTGLEVSELCLGTMTFGNEADEAASNAIMDRAAEAGINFFDTANIYNKGVSEEIVGRWLKPRRENFILASKVGGPASPQRNDQGNSRRNVLLAADRCLERLDTDWLDILYLHYWDDNTALEETLSAMTTLVEQGKVMYCAVSNFSAWQTMEAVALAADSGFAPIVCMQPMYNLVKRQAEVELLPLAGAKQLAACPYSPIGAGLLTGKYQRGETGRIEQNKMYEARYSNQSYVEISQRFVAHAQEKGLSPAALAVAWVNSHPNITSAIIGARNLDQFNDTLGCLDINLDPQARQEISALSIGPPLATDREK